jgi:hypothetical protein
MKDLLLSGLFFLSILSSTAQSVNDYRSNATGTWGTLTTWQRYNGSAWVTPTVAEGVPNETSGTITIRSGNSITIESNRTADQLILELGGSIVINPLVSFTIADGSGIDFSVGGSFLNQGDFILQNGATHSGMSLVNTFFLPNSRYRHQYTSTEGVIPQANWLSGSELHLEGYTSTFTASPAGNWNQNFSNVIWNCASQSGIANLAGLMTFVNNLTVLSTGSSLLRMSANENPVINITNDLTVSGTARLHLSTTGSNAVVNVGGDFIFNSTNAVGDRSIFTTTGSTTVNVSGNFQMNAPGGQLRLVSGAGGTGILNIAGNFDLTAGVLTEGGSGSASGNINFTGINATHTFNNSGSINNTINYIIPASNTLIALGESPLQGGTNSSLTLDGTLIVQSLNPTGAIINGTGAGAGNVRVTNANRFYNPGSVVIYQGSGPQFMGNGQPSAAGMTTIINNPSGVSLNNTSTSIVIINGDLTVQNGNLTVELDNLTIGGTLLLAGGNVLLNSIDVNRSITANGIVNLQGGQVLVSSGTANATLIVNGDITGSNTIGFSGANSNLTFNGSGNLSIDFPFPGPTTLKTVTLNRGSNGLIVFPQPVIANNVTISAGALRMNAALTVNNDLNLATGSILFFEGQTLELRSQFNNTLTGGVLSSDVNSTLNVLNAGTLGTLEFSPSGNVLGTFVLNRTTSGTLVTLNSPLTVQNIFTLQNGAFLNTSGLSFTSGTIVTRYNLASFATGSAVPAGGPYELFYEGVSTPNIATGVESQGQVNNLTSNFTGTVTVANNISVINDIIVNAGVFACGANAISSTSLILNGTLNAQTSTITLTGDFTNNGTFVRGSGTVVFNGNSNILGLNNPSFQSIVINGILNSPPVLNLHGAFTNNGTFNNGGGTVAFLGTAAVPQIISGTSVTSFNNINVSNTIAAPDVVIESNQNLTGVLTLAASSTFDADGSGNNRVFTLISSGDDPTSDASIAALPNDAAQVLGNVTAQRYMSLEGTSSLGNNRIYRYISSPVQNPTVADIQNEIPITGKFTGRSTCTGCLTNASMFWYNESAPGTLDDGYVAFPVSTNAETLVNGRGYAIFIRGDIEPFLSQGNARWDVSGPINRGSINYNVTYTTADPNPANNGWNLVGNPYPSTIDWESAGWTTRNRIGSTIYIRDNATGQFATYTLGGGSTNGGSQYIAMGQGFWVQAIPGAGSPGLISNETVKAAGQQTEFFRMREPSNILQITLKADDLRDETVIHFREDATDGFDYYADAWKLTNPTINLSTIAEGVGNMALNALGGLNCARTIPLDITGLPSGRHTLEFNKLETFDSSIGIVLIDRFTNEEIDIRQQLVYEFEVTSDSASIGNARFAVRFSGEEIKSDFTVVYSQKTCAGNDIPLTIEGSQNGVAYQAFLAGKSISNQITGNGESVLLTIPSGMLESGDNKITIQATTSSCLITKPVSVTLAQTPVVTTETFERCSEGRVELKVKDKPDGASVKWYESQDAVEPVGTGSNFITPELTGSQTYFVSIVGANGCESTRTPMQAIIRNVQQASIRMEDNNLISNYAFGNQWYFNGEPIEGAVEQQYSPSKSGLYEVRVSVGNCIVSDQLDFVFARVNREYPIAVYPNPVNDSQWLTIEFMAEQAERVQIINTTGARIIEVSIQSTAPGIWVGKADVSNLKSGVYVVQIAADGKTEAVRFVR